jgi:multidrug efflux pump subunit AcrB
VVALLILMLAPVVILRTPTDIFPNINIPVIAVAWQYTVSFRERCVRQPDR